VQDQGTYFFKPNEDAEGTIIELMSFGHAGGALSVCQDFIAISFG
jgi:hypothetical protein